MREVRTKTQLACLNLDLRGQVQGVGMRPLLYRIANKNHLLGEIFNSPTGAGARFDGSLAQLENFQNELKASVTDPIRIDTFTVEISTPRGFTTLEFKKSMGQNAELRLSAPPDLATCPLCWADFFNPQSRYFQYPFISCTDCGPRWSITTSLPFERENTSYQNFRHCSECKESFANPSDRRFHAQTLSCKNCGPVLELVGQGRASLEFVAEEIAQGKVGIIKGLGGFQLIGDATQPNAIQRIRVLKARPHQALAVMFRDLETFESCGGTLATWRRLSSPEAPILSCSGLTLPTQNLLAPDLNELGAMAPTTALHRLLMKYATQIVVTSANRKGQPIPAKLSELQLSMPEEVDFILNHNREITFPVDDSLMRGGQLLRAARGFCPTVRNAANTEELVLALGSDLKNSCALQIHDQRIDLPYGGTLSDLQSTETLRERLNKQLALFSFVPQQVLCDLHPQSLTPLLNPNPEAKLQRVPHHLAHAFAVARPGDLVLTFDGTGVDQDNEINGSEGYFFGKGGFAHVLQLAPLPLIGGDSAVNFPWKSLVAALATTEAKLENYLSLLPQVATHDIFTIAKLAQSPGQVPSTSFGRWFDAASALIGFAGKTQTYEAQAAICLESLAQNFKCESLANEDLEDLKGFYKKTRSNDPTDPTSRLQILGAEILLRLADQRLSGKYSLNELAFRAHSYMAQVVAAAIPFAHGLLPPGTAEIQRVVGTGGVFQNEVFSRLLELALSLQELPLVRPPNTPVNDQALAGGQLTYLQHLNGGYNA